MAGFKVDQSPVNFAEIDHPEFCRFWPAHLALQAPKKQGRPATGKLIIDETCKLLVNYWSGDNVI